MNIILLNGILTSLTKDPANSLISPDFASTGSPKKMIRSFRFVLPISIPNFFQVHLGHIAPSSFPHFPLWDRWLILWLLSSRGSEVRVFRIFDLLRFWFFGFRQGFQLHNWPQAIKISLARKGFPIRALSSQEGGPSLVKWFAEWCWLLFRKSQKG